MIMAVYLTIKPDDPRWLMNLYNPLRRAGGSGKWSI